jgi:hypothetical protein
VFSGVLPPAPPAAPSLYDRIDRLYYRARYILRQIICEILTVNRLIREFQHVALGRNLSLLVQLNEYCRRVFELAWVKHWMVENPNIDLDEIVDSSDDDELLFGRDPAPIFDYDSDSDGPEEVRFHIGEGPHAPTIALRTEDVDAYLRDPYQQRRARQGRVRDRGGTQILEQHMHSFVDRPPRLIGLVIKRARKILGQAERLSDLTSDSEDRDESDQAESSYADTEELEAEE